jgi:predicted O-methyltransferase YrrM
LKLGPALETLKELKGPYDFVFIDADKGNYANYYERCLELVRRGGIISIDNTLWSGWVADAKRGDDDTRALRAFNDKLHRDERVALSLLPLGDGVTLALKK